MKNKNLSQRAIIIAVITLLGLYVVIGPRHKPKLSDFTLAGIKNTLRENIRLGLDFRGGSHLVMQVKTDEYLKKMAEGDGSAAEKAVKKKVELNDWTLSTNGPTLTWTLGSAAQKVLSQQAVDQAMKIIESRINAV